MSVFRILFFIAFLPLAASAQSDELKFWLHQDPLKDSVQGMSVDRAYASLLKDRKSTPVVVAIIDSGIDIEHEDLQGSIWKNDDETPNNGIDDDNNGYVDDVHGWNFIGGKDGNVDDDTAELTREYKRLKNLFDPYEGKSLPRKLKKEQSYYQRVEQDYENSLKEQVKNHELYSNLLTQYMSGLKDIREQLNKEDIARSDLDSIDKSNPHVALVHMIVMTMPEVSLDKIETELKGISDHYSSAIKMNDLDFDPRHIVGDDYANLSEKYYGNNDVIGPDASHGTHVAGIIGANRKNNIGTRGIADNVKLMAVRTVPNGDERDKDVANAIRYAVDNGAHIINMSFGKSYSPHKNVVDAAIKYAVKNGVLLVHASGNDGKDVDIKDNYPTPYLTRKKYAATWLEIGASGPDKTQLAAPFSNYGKKTVTLFSPGVNIYSTTPDNEYEFNDGTSMASPATAGVAALLMSYFPNLSAVEVKEILINSSTRFGNMTVPQPGLDKHVPFSELSSTGGLVNAYEAVKLALETSNQ